MAIPPIYKFIAKLLRSKRRKQRAQRGIQETRRGQAYLKKKAKQYKDDKITAVPKRKYVHSAEWLAKHAVKLDNHSVPVEQPIKRGPGRPRKVVIVDGVAVMSANPTKAQIREAVDLCNKMEAVDAKASSALTDAQNLHALLMNQKKALTDSTNSEDVKELTSINKKIASVEMIIKGLGGK